MRRLLVALTVLAALAGATGVQAATTVSKVPFDDTFPLCNGDPIHLSGTLLLTTTENQTPSGGFLIAFHAQPQGVVGVDLVTGTVFHAVGLTRDVTVITPAGGATETFVNRFHIQATTGAQSFIISELFHTTLTPNGTVAVEFDKFSSTC
jgi:hypothetical protein